MMQFGLMQFDHDGAAHLDYRTGSGQNKIHDFSNHVTVLVQFETGLSLECGDLSPLWSAATCRTLCRLNSLQEAASSRRGRKR